jgi:DNA repair protein RadC
MLIKLNKNQRIQIKRSDEIYAIINDILNKRQAVDRDKEHLFGVGLRTNNTIKYIDLVSMGSLNGTVVCGREVFRVAILKSAWGIILLHNHPSNNPEPSSADKKITREMVQAGKYLSIPVLDHIIVTSDCGYFSFLDKGLLKEADE